MSKVICAAFQKGQKRNGVNLGAKVLANYCNVNNIKTVHIDEKLFLTSSKINSEIYNIFRDSSKYFTNSPLNKTIVLGGDHSVVVGSVLSNVKKYPNLGVIWLDAHADINTHNTSLSGNEHGMPLSIITGLDEEWRWTKKLKKLPYKNLMYYGLRDMDPFEKNTFISKGLKSTMQLNEVLNWAEDYNNIHLSLDIDGIDPSQCPSTGTPVGGGLSMTETLKLIKTLNKRDSLVGFDLVEYNPKLGTRTEKKRTLNNVYQILDAVFKH